MDTKKYLRRILTELYRADKVFIKTLESAVRRAKSPLPRIKRTMQKLITDANKDKKQIESDVEEVTSKPIKYAGSYYRYRSQSKRLA